MGVDSGTQKSLQPSMMGRGVRLAHIMSQEVVFWIRMTTVDVQIPELQHGMTESLKSAARS